jgi:hypothetical protein
MQIYFFSCTKPSGVRYNPVDVNADAGKNEKHVADFHTHPQNPNFLANGKDGGPFSTSDLVAMNNYNGEKSNGFASILETKTMRMASVITDEKSYKSFVADAEKHKKGLASASMTALKSEYKKHIASGSKEQFDEVGVTLRAQANYLKENNAGVELYMTTDKEKKEFKKVN